MAYVSFSYVIHCTDMIDKKADCIICSTSETYPEYLEMGALISFGTRSYGGKTFALFVPCRRVLVSYAAGSTLESIDEEYSNETDVMELTEQDHQGVFETEKNSLFNVTDAVTSCDRVDKLTPDCILMWLEK